MSLFLNYEKEGVGTKKIEESLVMGLGQYVKGIAWTFVTLKTYAVGEATSCSFSLVVVCDWNLIFPNGM
jgi:hypothetical protein